MGVLAGIENMEKAIKKMADGGPDADGVVRFSYDQPSLIKYFYQMVSCLTGRCSVRGKLRH
jgi:hypothetical protein